MYQKACPKARKGLSDLSTEELIVIQKDCSPDVFPLVKQELQQRSSYAPSGKLAYMLEWMENNARAIRYRVDDHGWVVEPPFAYKDLLEAILRH